MADPILVVLFLRGGMDGLNMVAPSGDEDYAAARAEALRVTRKGDRKGLAMSNPAADVDFRFHAGARGLSELYEAGDMAVVHASGLTDGTRSHFDAEDRMERAAKNTTGGGWLGRWLNGSGAEGVLPALSVGGGVPESVRGSPDVAVAGALADLVLPGSEAMVPLLAARLREGFGAHPMFSAPVARLLTLNDVLRDRLPPGEDDEYGQYSTRFDYGDGELAQYLKTVAHAIKLDLGLRVATVDFGGWDTHENQAVDFARQAGELSAGLSGFWRDLGQKGEDVTLVVMSEFGRRLRANSTAGTDHGFGNVMMVLGGQIRGGRMLGDWPGLANDALDDGADLAITTDYRHVLAEVLAHNGAGPGPDITFPGFTPRSVGLFG